MPRDVLEEILSAALREKATAAPSIEDFAAGLRDRARLILDERLRPVQERVATLEKENAWRASAILSLTAENERVVDENRRVKDEKDYAAVKERIVKREAERQKEAEENAKKDKLNK